MNSFKKLYLIGTTALILSISLVVAVIMGIYGSTSGNEKKPEDTSQQLILVPDTIIREVPVETIRRDTVYIPVKPKILKKDTSTVSPSTSSTQSQI